MMTKRQMEILIAIIEQYSEIAAPVGSVTLAKLFNVSSATIRNEMGILDTMGMIEQPYTSSGRIPTDKGYRTYVNYLTDADPKTRLRKTERSERLIDKRILSCGGQATAIIRSAIGGLAGLTNNLGIAKIGDHIYMSGLSNLFLSPEFASREQITAVSDLLDNIEPWLRETQPNEPINVYIGSENPIGKASGASLIVSRFMSPLSAKSYVGVLGSTRQNYANVMRLVEYTGEVLEEALSRECA